MNIQAAVVERRVSRSIMSRFHAGFSIGTVVGALAGALAVAVRLPVVVHLSAVALVTISTVAWSVRDFMADVDGPEQSLGRSDPGDVGRAGRRALMGWREPRTLLIGLFVLAFAFSEGAGQDWIRVALI